MNRQNDLHASMFEQSTHSGGVIACFDALCQTIKKKTVVLLDNASIHTSEEFEERLPSWKKQGLILKYLSPYSPELNLIEILWVRLFCYDASNLNICLPLCPVLSSVFSSSNQLQCGASRGHL